VNELPFPPSIDFHKARAMVIRRQLTHKDHDNIVGRSKTEAGAGRVVPLTRRACAALTFWLSRFPDADPDAFVFPFHRVAIAGNERIPHVYDVKLDRPMSPSSYSTAFETARRKGRNQVPVL
jgi:hypothetical protein